MAVVFIKKEWIFVVLELYLHTNFCWEYCLKSGAWFCSRVLQLGFVSFVRVGKRYEAWGLTLYIQNALN